MSWSKEQLQQYSDKNVREHTKSFFDGLPLLTDESREHEILRWIYIAAKGAMDIQGCRHMDALCERMWMQLAMILVAQMPPRFKRLVADRMQERSPLVLLDPQSVFSLSQQADTCFELNGFT